jgi:Na+/phosphate symporter
VKNDISSPQGDFGAGDDYLLMKINSSRGGLIMVWQRFSEEQVVVLSPMVDRLLTMMGAARDAFNRHSLASLRELHTLQGMVVQGFHDLARELKSLIARKSGDERLVLTQAHDILDHLKNIGEHIGQCEEPIERKIRGAILFSEKAVTQANFLFDQHSGVIRSVLDTIKTDNEFLKNYVLEEGRKLGQACLTFATEHEERMIAGVCLPQAAPIFLALLDRMRAIAQQEVEIAALLAGKP